MVEPLIDQSAVPAHLLQLYEVDDGALVANVSAYASQGLRRGQHALVIATAAHRDAIRSMLAADGYACDRQIARGRLALIDVDTILGKVMAGGLPDAVRFDQVVGAAVRRAVETASGNGVRVYGEIVGVLWNAKQYPAALRLEEFWQRLQTELGFTLFCGYEIDVFGKHFEGGAIDQLLCAHTHVLPTVESDYMERALERAAAELLGLSADELRHEAFAGLREAWGVIPRAEAAILWLRQAHPRFADTILESARTYYVAAARRASLRPI